MNIHQNTALITQSLQIQVGEKSVSGEIKSILPDKNAILVNLPNNTQVLLEIPQGANLTTENFSVGEKIEIPINVIKNAIAMQSLQSSSQEIPNFQTNDKFAAQTQILSDKAAEFSKIAETVIKAFGINSTVSQENIASLADTEKEFAKAFLKEIENVIKRLPIETAQNLIFPKAEDIKNIDDIFKWAITQIKSDNLPVKDFFALPQILFPSAPKIPENTQQIQTQTTPQIQIIPQDSGRMLYAPTATNMPAPDVLRNQTVAILPQFVQQTVTNIKENIQNLIPQVQNENIKAVLEEILKQTSTNTNTNNTQNSFAFVKIDAKNQDTANFSPNFLPLPKPSQFNIEFAAILSKTFPNLPKELFVETANIMRTNEKPFVLSENVLKNVENILKPLIEQNEKTPTQIQNETRQITPNIQNQPPPEGTESIATKFKITPTILANVLNFAANTNSSANETILQNFKILFSNEKTIDNVVSGIKNFVENFANIEKQIADKPIIQNEKPQQQTQILNEKPFLISSELTKSLEKLTDIQNILKNAETIFKKENSLDFLFSRIGILQNKSIENPQKIDESLRGVLREISEHIKTASVKLQNLPNLETDEKLSRAFSNLKDLANSMNDAARKMDGSTILASRGEIAAGRNEQTILIPVQIGNAWIQMEVRVNKDGKQKNNKHKKEASQVEVSVELDKGNSVSAKANLTLEKQLQVSINFTNEKMLEWFKMNYKEFCQSLESAGTKSVQVVFNRDKREVKRELAADFQKSNFELVG
jgi:hypothetical protein